MNDQFSYEWQTNQKRHKKNRKKRTDFGHFIKREYPNFI